MNFELETKINEQQIKELGGLIKDAQKILLVGHKNPDGDTIGCLTAMVEYLKSINAPFLFEIILIKLCVIVKDFLFLEI